MFTSVHLKLLCLVAVVQVASAQTNSLNKQNTSNITTIPDCDAVEPVKPDFRAPGRRLSEIKCYEYIWDLKNRVDQDERKAKCRKNLRKLTGVHFVVGGHKTIPGEFPHMGAIGWKTPTDTWIFKCGSSLISSKFVLTAAHCTKASPRDTSISDVDPKIIRFGAKNIYTDLFGFPRQIDATISRIIVHPNYAPPKKYFDIAIMELGTEIQFSRMIQPACLWNQADITMKTATVSGWGITKPGALNTSADLLAGDVDIINSSNCANLLKSAANRQWKGIEDSQICAGKPQGGVDACQGDSGGPLQSKIPLPKSYSDAEGSMYYVLGVTSFGVGCALPNLPGVYTRVFSFLDWIESIVWINQ